MLGIRWNHVLPSLAARFLDFLQFLMTKNRGKGRDMGQHSSEGFCMYGSEGVL